MGKRLSTKHRKLNRDKATAYKNGTEPKGHKVALARSKKMKTRTAFRMT